MESYNVASPPANFRLSGITLTIKPGADLLPATGYYIEIDATAIDDAAGNSFAGISGDGTWNFTTAAVDATAPEIDLQSPRPGATGAVGLPCFY